MLSELKKFSRPTIVLICVFSVVLVVRILPPIFWPGGIGIGKDNSVSTKTIEKDERGKTVKTIETIKYDDGKTLWDWGSLLGVPLSLAILGYVLQQQQQKRAEKLSEDQRRIADNETKEEVLQTYFDRLSVLLIDRNLIALSNKSNSSTITPEEQELLDSSLDVIRARTLSILRRFEKDPERKTSVIKFLIETEIVGKSKLNLSGADLSRADLKGANLKGANLKGANLQEANLQEANLEGANLQEANLQKANLQETNLAGANLEWTKLSQANFKWANFKGANFKGAYLFEANLAEANLQLTRLQGAYLSEANLQEANLREANLKGTYLSEANLEGANLEGANLEGANLKNIKWDSKTLWIDKWFESLWIRASKPLKGAENIPEGLKKQLGITP